MECAPLTDAELFGLFRLDVTLDNGKRRNVRFRIVPRRVKRNDKAIRRERVAKLAAKYAADPMFEI